MAEQQEVTIAEAKTSKAVRDPEVVAFDEGLHVPVVDDATLRGKPGCRQCTQRGRIHTCLGSLSVLMELGWFAGAPVARVCCNQPSLFRPFPEAM